MKPGWWKTADGRLLELAGMTDEHIQNCIVMLVRQIAEAEFSFSLYELLGGEQAREAALEAAGQIALNMHACMAKRDEIRAELERRHAERERAP